MIIAAQTALFAVGDAPVERLADFDTYYAHTPFIREMIVLYLVAHMAAALTTTVLCWRWTFQISGWTGRALAVLAVGWLCTSTYGVLKMVAVAGRWTGQHWDPLSTRLAPMLVTVGAVLTDNGREFCGKPESHPYELLLAVEGIEHRTTKVRSPRTNGFVERMNRTLLDECFRVEGRKTWYQEPAEIQRDLDRFLRYYNLDRSHQGYRLRGRTPAQALREALGIEELPPVVPAAQETETLEAA